MEKRSTTLLSLCITATIILSPLYIIRWSYLGNLPTTLLELLIWITLLIYGVRKYIYKEFSLIIPKIWWGGCLLLLTAGVLSIGISSDRMAAIGIARAYLVEPVLFFIMLLDLYAQAEHVKEYVPVKKLLRFSLFGAGLWISVMGIFQYLFQWPIITEHQWDRAHGVFNNGNALALFVGPILAYLMAETWLRKKEPTRPCFILLVSYTLALFMSLSLGGVIALVGTIGLIFLSRMALIRKLFPYGYVVVLGLFLVFLTQTPRLAPDVVNPWDRPGGTATVRLCIWEGTYNLLKDKPILGAGLRSFQSLYGDKYYTCDAEPLVYPHNIFLNFWVELGILGLFAFSVIFVYVFRQPTNPATYFFVYILIHGLVDVPYFKNDLAVLFWVGVMLWIIHKKQIYSEESLSAGG